MKRSSFLVAVSVLVLLAALALTIRPSLASRGAKLDEVKPIANAPLAAAAGSASVFSYQGQLTNATGNPITNASLPMTFRLFPTYTEGTVCWTETQNVNVQNGQFNILLGQSTAIPTSCVASNAYLELVVNGETLSPRELLTSVAAAVKADTLVSGAQTQGPLIIPGEISVNNEIIANPGLPDNSIFHITNNSGGLRLRSSRSVNLYVDTNNDSTDDGFNVYRDAGNDAATRILRLDEQGNLTTLGALTATGVCNGNGTCLSGTDVFIGGQYALHAQPEADTLHLLPFANGLFDQVCIGCGVVGRGLVVRGGLEVHGGCIQVANSADGEMTADADCEPGSITSGAYVEANLMTQEERSSESVDYFERGDLLCWSANDQQLELCSQENDRLVMAVADADGKPIVLGAEPVKVIGPVVAGDLLVASNVSGHAIVNNDPLPGTVIGQALQDLDGESGIIKAMIRKW